VASDSASTNVATAAHQEDCPERQGPIRRSRPRRWPRATLHEVLEAVAVFLLERDGPTCLACGQTIHHRGDVAVVPLGQPPRVERLRLAHRGCTDRRRLSPNGVERESKVSET